MTVTRRRVLGALGLIGAASAGIVELLRGRAVPALGVTRLVEHYGPGARQLGEWWAPARTGLLPAVVLVHGGYWRPSYDRHLEDALAADLSGRGFLVWNVDYAPASWPGTLADTAAAYDATFTGAFADRVDRARVAVVGHSAGGHLALWLA
ncbi:MAG: alpha/beta hydrolase, partial [Mycobacteriales bacterium]